MAGGGSPHRGQTGGLWAGAPPGFCFGTRLVMSEPDFLHFHAREAARYRRFLANATTPAVKARLAEQAAQHERLAEALEHVKEPAEA